MPFGLDMWSLIIGILLGAYVWPYVWAMLYGLIASATGKKTASPNGI